VVRAQCPALALCTRTIRSKRASVGNTPRARARSLSLIWVIIVQATNIKDTIACGQTCLLRWAYGSAAPMLVAMPPPTLKLFHLWGSYNDESSVSGTISSSSTLFNRSGNTTNHETCPAGHDYFRRRCMRPLLVLVLPSDYGLSRCTIQYRLFLSCDCISVS